MMYGLNSLLIAIALLASMLAAIEAGYRAGRRFHPSAVDSYRSHVNAIQASMLGVLALLLGFTFSLALQRFDSRSEAEIDEANAIGTAYLRAQLLPDSVRGEVQSKLQEYVDLRIHSGEVTLDHEAARHTLLSRSDHVLEELWQLVRMAAKEDNSVVTTGLFIQSLNEAIDSYGRREGELDRHVPQVILLLLYFTFVMTGGVVGFSSGISNHRPPLVTYILVLLIVVLTFIIIDLDRPRRGLIKVDQTGLLELKSSFGKPGLAKP